VIASEPVPEEHFHPNLPTTTFANRKILCRSFLVSLSPPSAMGNRSLQISALAPRWAASLVTTSDFEQAVSGFPKLSHIFDGHHWDCKRLNSFDSILWQP
jgi:hypothetical protein